MKIALIGPGIMKIPPDRWGAVEMMIWDYAIILKDLGHRVQIINTPDKDVIKFEVEYGKFDVVHLHYDVFADILEDLAPHCKLLIASTILKLVFFILDENFIFFLKKFVD